MLSIYVKAVNFISRLAKKEDGVTAIEYALIAAGIAVVIIVAVKTLGNSTSTAFNTVANAV